MPVAATTNAPRLWAVFTASRIRVEGVVPPRLRLMIRAPCSAAQTMPAATAVVGPLPAASRTLTGMIRACQAIPATPWPLSVAAAAMLATWVP